MKDREVTKKNILLLQQLEFEAEANLYRQDKVNVEEKYKEFLKTIPKQTKLMNFTSPEKQQDIGKENRERKRDTSVITGIKQEIPLLSIAHENTDSSMNVFPVPEKKNIHLHKKVKPPGSINRYEKAISSQTEKSQTGLAKIESKKIAEKLSDFVLKHRIRLDRNNNLIIDRYVQSSSGFSPFDDDFNKYINKFKIYNEDFVLSNKKASDFDTLYEDYLKGKYSGLVVSDSEEDQSTVNSQVRSFSSSYKQFLKHKRSHPEVI